METGAWVPAFAGMTEGWEWPREQAGVGAHVEQGFHRYLPDVHTLVGRFACYRSVSVGEAGPDGFGLQELILLENGIRCITCGQHSRYMLHGYAHIADDWLASEDICPDSNAA